MQLEFFDVPSPCVGVCQSNEKGYCLGCMRTREERKTWPTLNNNSKQKVIKRCIQRKKRQNNKNSSAPTVVVVQAAKDAYQPEQPSLLEPLSKSHCSDNNDNDNDLDFSDFEL